jgi:hypothetical protein
LAASQRRRGRGSQRRRARLLLVGPSIPLA